MNEIFRTTQIDQLSKLCFWLTQWHMSWVTTHLILSLIIKHTLKISLFTSYNGNLYYIFASQIFPPSVQFSSVTQSCPTLCNPMDCSMPGFPVHHQLPELAQTHVHRVADAIQPYHLLLSPSPPALNLSQNQCLFKWVNSSHQLPKGLEFQLQHQSFQWTLRTDLL